MFKVKIVKSKVEENNSERPWVGFNKENGRVVLFATAKGLNVDMQLNNHDGKAGQTVCIAESDYVPFVGSLSFNQN